MPKHGRNVIGRKRGANGFLAQARVDLQAAEVVAASGLATSTLAMLLQMVFEKLAKAALLRMRSISVAHATSTHATAGRLLRTLQHERRRFAMLAAISRKGIASWCRQRAGPKPDLRAGARFPLIKRSLGGAAPPTDHPPRAACCSCPGVTIIQRPVAAMFRLHSSTFHWNSSLKSSKQSVLIQ